MVSSCDPRAPESIMFRAPDALLDWTIFHPLSLEFPAGSSRLGLYNLILSTSSCVSRSFVRS